jgi:cysteinyl-tRNA synthetase
VVKEKTFPEIPEEKPITLREVLNKGYTGREIRYWLINMHYRRAIDFSWSKLMVS